MSCRQSFVMWPRCYGLCSQLFELFMPAWLEALCFKVRHTTNVHDLLIWLSQLCGFFSSPDSLDTVWTAHCSTCGVLGGNIKINKEAEYFSFKPKKRGQSCCIVLIETSSKETRYKVLISEILRCCKVEAICFLLFPVFMLS